METWETVCHREDLVENTGVCALLGDEQVAVFLCGRSNALYAVSNYDPIGKANVMSRGMIGSLGDKTVVASPLYKQHFCLETGICLENETVSLKTYKIKVSNDSIKVAY